MLGLAPRPLRCSDERYPHPVIVQQWLDGHVDKAPPATEGEWQALLEHYAAIHRLSAERLPGVLRPAAVAMAFPEAALARIEQAYGRIMDAAGRAQLLPLIQHQRGLHLPRWPAAAQVLCRCDPNLSTFIRRPGTWASLDWGDPTFEPCDLMAHPAYSDVPSQTWDRAVEQHCRQMQQPGRVERIWLDYRLMVV